MAGNLKTLLCCATLLAGTGLASSGAFADAAGEAVTRVEAGRPVAFDVMMPLSNRDRLEAFVADLHNPASPNFHHWVTPAQFGMRFGPKASDVKAVAASLRSRGFTVVEQTRSLHVTGTSDQVERNFATHLLQGRTQAGETHIMQEGSLALPAEIAATGAQVFSFSPHVSHTNAVVVTGKLDPDNRRSSTGGYWWTDLKQAYSYPSVLATAVVGGQTVPLNGTGVKLGVLMEGDIYDKDIKDNFDHEKYTQISGKPVPTVARVLVNGGTGRNGPGLAEASLDTQEETTGAPGAQVTLYNIPDLSDGNVSAGYITIVESNAVDLVSSSFGGCELFDSPAYNGGTSYYGILKAQHELFLQGNAQGITFLASSGDSAGKQCPSPSYFTGGPATFKAGLETPASDPAVTAVGGTNVITGGSLNSLTSPYSSENGWSDPEIPFDPYGVGVAVSGGSWGAGSGYSGFWKQPDYQAGIPTGSTTRRAVPDIGMQVGGCPGGISILDPADNRCDGNGNKKDGYPDYRRSYVIVSIAGNFYGLIGTSVSSPEMAGALATLIETQGRQGNVNYYLYGLAAKQAAGQGTFFHTGIPGFNGIKNTNLGPVYGLTIGVGTPFVAAMVGQPNAALAGIPQTPSNP